MLIALTKWETWVYGLVSGFIGGASTALLGQAGLATIGQTLNWKQLGVVALAGGLSSAIGYLAKSPLPPLNGNGNDHPITPNQSQK